MARSRSCFVLGCRLCVVCVWHGLDVVVVCDAIGVGVLLFYVVVWRWCLLFVDVCLLCCVVCGVCRDCCLQ